MTPTGWILWGSELSPFTLKVLRLFRQARLPVRLLPAGGGFVETLRFALRRERLVRGMLPLTYPEMAAEDEFPLVPYVFGPDGENLYDSSAIAEWLDRGFPHACRFTRADPATAFLVRLIDEFADEWGLYLAHHQRWKVSATDNDAGRRLAREFGAVLGPLQPLFARHFARRQVRRLPYLFSIAPADYRVEGLPAERQPPSHRDFPPTHALLEASFLRLLDALEPVLASQPFLFGGCMTLADASLYGELGMNLSDPSSNRLMQQRAPSLHAWLERMHGPDVIEEPEDTPALPTPARLGPLIDEIRRTFIPLMQQNHAAWIHLQANGQACWNEAAFWKDEALYDGTLDGQPFRHVAKTFQARVWVRLCHDWQALPAEAHHALHAFGLRGESFQLPGR